jgi:methylmalonate-semialdehyde dehydrogenase [acylating] (EC 1.2.1.27)
LKTDMQVYTQEIFGPVLVTLEVDTLDEAIALVNANPFGNGTGLFTQSGAAARKFQSEIDIGQVGINIPIPVPVRSSASQARAAPSSATSALRQASGAVLHSDQDRHRPLVR